MMRIKDKNDLRQFLKTEMNRLDLIEKQTGVGINRQGINSSNYSVILAANDSTVQKLKLLKHFSPADTALCIENRAFFTASGRNKHRLSRVWQ
jgi:hypothetical protein